MRALIEDKLRREPEDWQSWLVYADWLADRGDVRGEAIAIAHRLQTVVLDDAERVALQRRQGALCDPRRRLERLVHHDCINGMTWKHGFVWSADFDRQRAVEAFEELSAHPDGALLREATFRALDDAQAQALAASPHLRKLYRLEICYSLLSEESAQLLGRSEHLENLRELYFAGPLSIVTCGDLRCLVRLVLPRPGGPEGARALAACPSLSGLVELDLFTMGPSGIEDEGARALAASPHLRSLARLDLSNNEVTGEGIEALCASPHLPSLVEIDESPIDRQGTLTLELAGSSEELAERAAQDLRRFVRLSVIHYLEQESDLVELLGREDLCNLVSIDIFGFGGALSAPFDGSTAQAIALSPRLQGLTRLVWKTVHSPTDAEIEVLAGSANLRHLHSLHLRGRFGDRGAVALAASPHLRSLAELELIGDLGDEGMCALSRMEPPQGLARLHLGTPRVGPEGARALVRSGLLDSVTELHLFGAGDVWAGALSEAELPSLQRLRLSEVGPEGAHALARASRLGALQGLDLTRGSIGDEGFIALMTPTDALPALRELSVEHNGISDKGLLGMMDAPCRPLISLNLDQNSVSEETARALLRSPLRRALSSLRICGLYPTHWPSGL